MLEILKLLANLTNLSATWAAKIAHINGAVLCLARVLLGRRDISKAVGHASNDDVSENTEEEAADGNDTMSTAGTETFKSSRTITSEEILCLVLAIFTSAVTADRRAAELMATISESRLRQFKLMALQKSMKVARDNAPVYDLAGVSMHRPS